MYQQRLGKVDDATAIAPLWQTFLQERAKYDPSIILKTDFDYVSYVKKKLASPSIYGFLLEYGESQEIVGFLFTYVHDETPTLDYEDVNDSPFLPRRIGGAIGMYIQPPHRKPEAISLLIESAIALAKELKISDLDLLISIEQTAVQKLLEKFGFKKAAIQYSQHYDISDQNLPRLRTPTTENIAVKMPIPGMIPLRDPKTQQPVINPQGKQVFLHPVKNELGETLKSSNGLPIYPTPLRDPQTQDWVFNELGELVTCPVVLDGLGKVKEKQGIPLFKHPIYEMVDGKLRLKKDDDDNYLFEE
ncbi:MAG: GNAT family N-acetyltransferase [Crocosphaera sp.]|nr:GNAT family N-acetyltransferase [Crocosphaera sp.]